MPNRHTSVGRASSPGPKPHQYLFTSTWIGHQELSRCHTKIESEESVACRSKHVSKGKYPGFETQGRHHPGLLHHHRFTYHKGVKSSAPPCPQLSVPPTQ